MCCGSKKKFVSKSKSEVLQSMSVQADYVLMEFIGVGSSKKYRIPETNKSYWAGGRGEHRFIQVHKDDVNYFLNIKKNRTPQFKVREDFVYKPQTEQPKAKQEISDYDFSLDENEDIFEHRENDFEELALTDIKNIGKVSAEKLLKAGIETVDQLSKLDIGTLMSITSLPEHKAKSVMEQLENVQLQEE
jgi:predicted flap endonuclease-1-like 5' DNA nuclease